ncbi:hypothetical protein NDN08_003098 [Rhodosorus marinus]|uniref:HAUS augmin-like complex subunit 6 N-terminal domain-containing protein n=1 Tax=Rhodosorus marinus TaxID=101924 RepID=A0AAV8UVJ1_9RHOD|nr:hypothetical protein NDN08_003098 [Rhodosorus marinus]
MAVTSALLGLDSIRADLKELGYHHSAAVEEEDIITATERRLEVIKWLLDRFSEGSGEDFSIAHGVNGLSKALIRLGISLDQNSAQEMLKPSVSHPTSKSAGLLRNLIDVAMSVIIPVDLNSVLHLSSLIIKSSEDSPKTHHIAKTDVAKEMENTLDGVLERRRELEEKVASIVLVENSRKESNLEVANIDEIGASVAEAQKDCQSFREVVERVLEIDRRWMCPREEAGWRERISECTAAEESVHKFSTDVISIVSSKDQIADLSRSITSYRLELNPVVTESLSELSAANAVLESIN